MEALQEGLRLDPTGPSGDPKQPRGDGWDRLYSLAHWLGQGPLAGRALALALTAAPDSPERVEQSWDLIREAQGPAVDLEKKNAR